MFMVTLSKATSVMHVLLSKLLYVKAVIAL